jgi:serine/threonine protein kinase
LDKEDYFLQLVSVVSYAHKHKILHRDIKPENIIVSKNGRIKLLDFGIARDLSWQSGDTSSAGTVNYMPPEQFEGKSCIASDVWAIGVIFYIFATNAVPYDQLNNHYPADIETTMESRAPCLINPHLDKGLERIIMRCLQKDLDKRYGDATELEADLMETFPQFGRGMLLPP